VEAPNPLVLSWRKPGCPLCAKPVFDTCRKAARLAGIDKPVLPNSLRHVFATPLLDDGVNVLKYLGL
jgi:site-specific recombinase XerD